jgi:hypothetical protein
MNPTDPQAPQPPQPTPTVDYLNQIAPQAPRRPSWLKPGPKLFALIGSVLVVIVLTLVIIVNVAAAAQRQPLQHLAARLDSTEKIAGDAQKKLKTSELRSLNSNLKIYLTNTQRDISAPLLAAGVNTDKLSDSVVKQESSTAIEGRLEDARLNATYDRTYAREMSYQLNTLLSLMNQIYKSTGSKSLKEFLETSYKNLEPTQKAFADFDAANS